MLINLGRFVFLISKGRYRSSVFLSLFLVLTPSVVSLVCLSISVRLSVSLSLRLCLILSFSPVYLSSLSLWVSTYHPSTCLVISVSFFLCVSLFKDVSVSLVQRRMTQNPSGYVPKKRKGTLNPEVLRYDDYSQDFFSEFI